MRPVPTRSSRAFSLLELLVVIAVAVMLTGLLMPAMHNLQENARRVICLSNLSQLGQGFLQYSIDYKDLLPYSAALHDDHQPQNLMMVKRPDPNGGWDGIGLLFQYHYCGAPECYYCPSHHGEHPFDRYTDVWSMDGNYAIFSNYHYAGDIEWGPGPNQKRRNMLDGHTLVLATDGLRTAKDFNHLTGMNVLRGDGSVRWHDDNGEILQQLPKDENDLPQTSWPAIWDDVAHQH
jgi:competence protein ComGC